MNFEAKNHIKYKLQFLFSYVSLKNLFKIILFYTIFYIFISRKSVSKSNFKNSSFINVENFSVNLKEKLFTKTLTAYTNRSLTTLKIEKSNLQFSEIYSYYF